MTDCTVILFDLQLWHDYSLIADEIVPQLCTMGFMLSSKIIPVSIFNKLVDVHLRDLGDVVVEGEISQLQISGGKWLFMTIKDDRASVGVFGAAFRLDGIDLLEEGMRVHVYGNAGLYQKTGRFNLNATKIVPAGEGALRLAYEKLKNKLQDEGLFDPARKRKITRFPQKIGLITASGSRAYGDFVKVLSERMGGIEIHFYPINVQGDLSVPSILKAFKYFNNQLGFDALILTRGGGSLEDLWSFNDEKVARAVFGSKFPVISGIGHEDDVALTDFVADMRASTPSNVAELLIPSKSEVISDLDRLTLRLDRSIESQLREWRETIDYQMGVLDGFFVKKKEDFRRLMTKLEGFLTLKKEKVLFFSQKNQILWQKLKLLPESLVIEKRRDLVSLERLLQSLDYKNVLKRGFTMTRDSSGKLVRSVEDVNAGDKIETVFVDGGVVSEVLV